MPQAIKSLLIASTIVLLWAVSSALVGAIFGVAPQCASLGVFICAILLVIAHENENTWRRMTGQAHHDEDSAVLFFAALFAIPVGLLVAAPVLWLSNYLFPPPF